MTPAIIAALLALGTDLVDRFFPNKETQAAERANATMQMQELVMKAQAAITAALAASDASQSAVNLADAQSSDKFKSWARPAAIWVCVFGLAYQFLVWPVLTWGCANFHWIAPPQLPGDALNVLLYGLLGLGAYRSFDKFKGTA